MKFCIDCKYCVSDGSYRDQFRCASPKYGPEEIDMVTGKAVHPMCGSIRLDSDLCGTVAAWFEPKIEWVEDNFVCSVCNSVVGKDEWFFRTGGKSFCIKCHKSAEGSIA